MIFQRTETVATVILFNRFLVRLLKILLIFTDLRTHPYCRKSLYIYLIYFLLDYIPFMDSPYTTIALASALSVTITFLVLMCVLAIEVYLRCYYHINKICKTVIFHYSHLSFLYIMIYRS